MIYFTRNDCKYRIIVLKFYRIEFLSNAWFGHWMGDFIRSVTDIITSEWWRCYWELFWVTAVPNEPVHWGKPGWPKASWSRQGWRFESLSLEFTTSSITFCISNSVSRRVFCSLLDSSKEWAVIFCWYAIWSSSAWRYWIKRQRRSSKSSFSFCLSFWSCLLNSRPAFRFSSLAFWRASSAWVR